MKRALALLLVLSCVFALCGCGLVDGILNTGIKFENVGISAMLDEDEHGHIFNSGAEISIEDEIVNARLSPDRQKMAVLAQDGRLWFYGNTSDLSDEIKVTDNGYSLNSVGNTGLVYTDEDSTVHRYSYAEDEDTVLGDADAWLIDIHFNMIYAVDGKIYYWEHDSGEEEQVAKYDPESDFDLVNISDDGKSFVWYVADDDTADVYIYEDGETEKVGSLDMPTSYSYVNATYNDASTCAVIYSYSDDTIYVKPIGKDAIKVKLGSDYAGGLYTTDGPFAYDTGKSFNGLYISVDSDDGSDLYYIDKEGDREKVKTDIQDFYIYKGYIYYVDAKDALYCAKLKGAELGEPEKISSSVDYMTYSLQGGYIYYLKDDDGDTAKLYAYKRGKDPVKVASDVYSYTYSIMNSTDGKTVYYFKDVEEYVGDTYDDVGTLYAYTYGASESVKISNDVVTDSLNSYLTPNELDPASFRYCKYQSDGEDQYGDSALVVNIMYYNGKESSVVSRNVIY